MCVVIDVQHTLGYTGVEGDMELRLWKGDRRTQLGNPAPVKTSVQRTLVAAGSCSLKLAALHLAVAELRTNHGGQEGVSNPV